MHIEKLARRCDDLEKRVSQIETRHRHEDEGWEKIRRDIRYFRDAKGSQVYPLDR